MEGMKADRSKRSNQRVLSWVQIWDTGTISYGHNDTRKFEKIGHKHVRNKGYI